MNPQRSAAILIGVCALVCTAVAAAGTPQKEPPGQAKKQDTSSSTSSSSSSTSNSDGVKPSSTTDHNTSASAGSNQTKKYGNGQTAGQIAMKNGASSDTELKGPGNSQPHKVAVCSKNGKTHYVDVHALKSHRAGACSTSGTNGTSNSSGAASGQSAASATPSPKLGVEKLERVGASGAFVAGPVDAATGDTVFYVIVLSNQGNTTLHVTLSDPGCDSGTLSPITPEVTIDPGKAFTYYCSHVLTTADGASFTNIATANGESVSTTANAVNTASAPVVANVVAGVKGAQAVLRARGGVARGGVKGAQVTLRPRRVAKPAAAHAQVKAASFTG